MLPLEECRRLLGPDCDLNDEEVGRLCESLSDLAAAVVEGFVELSPTEGGIVRDSSRVAPASIHGGAHGPADVQVLRSESIG